MCVAACVSAGKGLWGPQLGGDSSVTLIYQLCPLYRYMILYLTNIQMNWRRGVQSVFVGLFLPKGMSITQRQKYPSMRLLAGGGKLLFIKDIPCTGTILTSDSKYF